MIDVHKTCGNHFVTYVGPIMIHGNPLQYSCLENFVAGYSPWCYKESDMTERLSTAQSVT